MHNTSNPLPKTLRTAIATAVLAGAGLTSFSAMAASGASTQRLDAAARAEIQQTYRAERAACTDGSSTQERGACLAEAAAARKEALAGSLGMQNVARNESARPGEPDLLANALARCDAVPGDVRLDCERRIIGGDSVIVVGSVAEGVIVRELAPAEPAVMVAQAETRLAPTQPAQPMASVVAEPQEPTMDAPAAGSPQAAVDVDASLSAGETRVPVDTAQATGQIAEPVDTAAAAAPPQAGADSLGQPMADMAQHPAIAPADSTRVEALPGGAVEVMSETQAAAEAQAQADAQRAGDATAEAEARAMNESAAAMTEGQFEAADAARGADPVAYPEWMVQQRFE